MKINVYDLLRVARHLQLVRTHVHRTLDNAIFCAAQSEDTAKLLAAAKEREAFQQLELTPEQIATMAAMPTDDITKSLVDLITVTTN